MGANGDQDPPLLQRVFWALIEGATATALLVAGGKDSLGALQVTPSETVNQLTFHPQLNFEMFNYNNKLIGAFNFINFPPRQQVLQQDFHTPSFSVLLL